MSARTLLVASAVLGLLLLIPVLAIVGLGAYGESITAQDKPLDPSQARLNLLPDHGPPGSTVTVEGVNWPPRAVVTVYLARPSAQTGAEPSRQRLGKIVSSRNGTFRFGAVLPSALVARSPSVSLIAEASGEANDLLAAGSAEFAVESHPNSLSVRFLDSRSRETLQGVSVEIRDGFGQVISQGVSDQNGALSLTGITPGRAALVARQAGYYMRHIDLAVGDVSNQTMVVALEPAPGSWLIAPATMVVGEGSISFMAVDRWSGLPISKELQIPADAMPPRPNGLGNRYTGYLLPVDLPADGSTAPKPGVLWMLGSVQEVLAQEVDDRAQLLWAKHLGSTPFGDLFHGIASSNVQTYASRVLLIDPSTRRIVYQRSIEGSEMPVLTADRSTLLLINISSGALKTLEIASGDTVPQPFMLPHPLRRAVVVPSDERQGLLLTFSGDIYKLDPEAAGEDQVFSSVPGATWIAAAPDGRLILANPSQRELVLIDQRDGGLLATIRLPTPADWVWVDPKGPFIYSAGRVNGVLTVHLIDAASFQFFDTLRFPPITPVETVP